MLKSDAELKLQEMYSNLIFYLSPDKRISVWVKRKVKVCGEEKETSSEGIHLSQNFKPEDLPCEFFDDLNTKLQKITDEPKKYFWCTTCSSVKEWDEFEENVFAGYYCKECAANSKQIRDLIAESHKAGFYD